MSYLSDYLYQYFDEVSYKEFYRDVFPVGSFEQKGVFEKGKYNGILVEVTNEKLNSGKPRVLRHTITDDLEKLDPLDVYVIIHLFHEPFLVYKHIFNLVAKNIFSVLFLLTTKYVHVTCF